MKILNIFTAVCVVLLFYFAWSFCDIIADNNTTAQHNKYNIFCLINDLNE